MGHMRHGRPAIAAPKPKIMSCGVIGPGRRLVDGLVQFVGAPGNCAIACRSGTITQSEAVIAQHAPEFVRARAAPGIRIQVLDAVGGPHRIGSCRPAMVDRSVRSARTSGLHAKHPMSTRTWLPAIEVGAVACCHPIGSAAGVDATHAAALRRVHGPRLRSGAGSRGCCGSAPPAHRAMSLPAARAFAGLAAASAGVTLARFTRRTWMPSSGSFATAGAAGGTVAQAGRRWHRIESSRCIRSHRRAVAALGFSRSANPNNGTAIPLVPHISASLTQGVSKPLPVSALYSMSFSAKCSSGCR